MSVVALSDLLFGDLLTETNMKPWWEKIRGYFFASSMAFALSATYLTLNGVPVNCLPAETGNMSFTYNFTKLQGEWTNTYCSNNMPWYFSYLGPLSLAAAACLLLTSSFWLYIPEVIDSFVTFFEMERITSDTNMTLEKMQKLYCQPLESHSENDNRTKLRKVCVEIWEGERDFKLKNVYLMRNGIFIGASILIGIGFVVIAHFMRSHGHRFRCNITGEDVELLNENQRFPVLFVCISSLACRLIIYDIIFATSVFAQVVSIGLGMLQWTCSNTELHGFDNAAFMIYLWKYSKPSRSKTFSRLIEHVCRKEAVYDIKNELKNAVLIKDHDLIRNFIDLSKIDYPPSQDTPQSGNRRTETENPVDFIMTMITEIYKSQFEGKFPKVPEEIRKIETAIVATISKHVTSETTLNKCKPILKKASADRRWKLFVEILNECICKLSDPNSQSDSEYGLLTDLHVHCDILDDDGCSIMHYFHDKPRLESIASLVIRQYEYMGLKLYAHSRGKSSFVKKTRNTFIITNFSVPNSQKKIIQYYKEFLGILNPLNQFAVDKLNGRLSLVKFHDWDEDAKKFAIEARSKQMWSTFVTLLNCYIVPENEKDQIVPLPCESTDSNILWVHATPSRTLPFVSTAAKYILTCLTPDDRMKVRSEITSWVNMEDAKNELLQFIDRYNKCLNDGSHDNAMSNDAHEPDENTLDLRVATADNATSSISSGQSTTTTEESCAIDMEKEPLVQYNSQ